MSLPSSDPAGPADPAEYAAINQANWDERAPAHAASPDYEVERLLSGDDQISGVVAFDRPRLGELSGLRAVHLQCHIGTDTLSLHRLGARMSGLDLSGASLEQARRIAASAGADIDYHQAELYQAPEVFGAAAFDLVYTGIGALCWLPDVRRWAEVVATLLKPDGRLFIREGHPALWALDYERDDSELAFRYPYFTPDRPLVWDDPETYVATDAEFTSNRTMEWNHSLGQILTAVLDAGLRIDGFEEHDSVPWRPMEAFVPVGGGEFALPPERPAIPASYTLPASRPA